MIAVRIDKIEAQVTKRTPRFSASATERKGWLVGRFAKSDEKRCCRKGYRPIRASVAQCVAGQSSPDGDNLDGVEHTAGHWSRGTSSL